MIQLLSIFYTGNVKHLNNLYDVLDKKLNKYNIILIKINISTGVRVVIENVQYSNNFANITYYYEHGAN